MLLFEICSLKGHTCIYYHMKYQRSYIGNQSDGLRHHYPDLHSMKSGLNQYSTPCFTLGLWVSAGPRGGCSPLGTEAPCSRPPSRAEPCFYLQAQSPVNVVWPVFPDCSILAELSLLS